MKMNEKLISLRKEKGWSQEELANKLNISRQAISKWELGESTPDTNNMMQLSKLYGKSLDNLLENKIQDHKPKLKNVFIIIGILLIVIIIIYGILCIIKYNAISKINEEFTNYKVLSNYSFTILDMTMDKENITEQRNTEVYYKDGILKKIFTSDNTKSILFTNFNTGESYITNENTKEISDLDVSKIPDTRGQDISMLNPSVVYCNNDTSQKVLLAISPKLKISTQNGSYIVKYEDHTIWINKDTGLPIKTVSIDKETQTEHRSIFEFKIDQTSDEDILGVNKNEYTKNEY